MTGTAREQETNAVTSNSPRKVCAILVDRANYGRLKPVLSQITTRPELQLQLVATGTMVLQRFGYPVAVVKADGYQVDSEIHIELEGSTPATMAKSVGFGIVEFASEFQRLQPDLVLLIGDRYEALAAAVAAAYMNICIVHIQGGEVSGSIDESARHAITKLAHFHFPSTVRAAEYLQRMGERADSILGVGCPSSDIARQLNLELDSQVINGTGSGAQIDLAKPFLLVMFHPTTTSYGGEQSQIEEVLSALEQLHLPTILLWPNIDAGADRISKSIRVFRDRVSPEWLRTITNLPPEDYLRLLAKASSAVGNSSSFVRDAGYFGTPVVLVGDRQEGRETDVHVIPVEPAADEIARVVRHQMAHGRYAPSTLYGSGHVAEQIAEQLVLLRPYIQKRLDYIYDKELVKANGHAGSWNRHRPERVEGYPPKEYRASAR